MKYSRRFRAIWIRQQHGDFDSFLGVMEHLSYSPNRMDSEADPRAVLIDKMGANIDTCIEVCADKAPSHADDAFFAGAFLLPSLDRRVSPTSLSTQWTQTSLMSQSSSCGLRISQGPIFPSRPRNAGTVSKRAKRCFGIWAFSWMVHAGLTRKRY